MTEAIQLVRDSEGAPSPILGGSPAMLRAVDLARRFARSRAAVLLVGPTGSGKELLAQHLHAWSGRRGPIVDINCGALPRELIESTIFGHARGAFTGAVDSRAGLVEAADGGTLFLDEICSMPLDAQSKLLRVLDTMSVRRVGETERRPVDFRLIAASQVPLADRVAEGTFRLDLLQRIAGVVIQLTGLAQRREDVVPLARAFAASCGKALENDVAGMLLAYSWPGNVRELRNVIERAAWLCDDRQIDVRSLEEAMSLGAVLPSCAAASANEERDMLVRACEADGWSARRVATRLGIGRTTLYRRLVDFGISLRQRKRIARLRSSVISSAAHP